MKLNKFLVKAKINTYASNGEINERNLEDGTKELTYKEDEFEYRDRYYGFNPFIGEEIIWQNGKIVWAMNYYGKIISLVVPAKTIYQFLKIALKQVKEDKPFRGPKNFKNGDFKYTNKAIGKINNFSGKEKIFFKGKEIYTLIYHGGTIKLK